MPADKEIERLKKQQNELILQVNTEKTKARYCEQRLCDARRGNLDIQTSRDRLKALGQGGIFGVGKLKDFETRKQLLVESINERKRIIGYQNSYASIGSNSVDDAKARTNTWQTEEVRSIDATLKNLEGKTTEKDLDVFVKAEIDAQKKLLDEFATRITYEYPRMYGNAHLNDNVERRHEKEKAAVGAYQAFQPAVRHANLETLQNALKDAHNDESDFPEIYHNTVRTAFNENFREYHGGADLKDVAEYFTKLAGTGKFNGMEFAPKSLFWANKPWFKITDNQCVLTAEGKKQEGLSEAFTEAANEKLTVAADITKNLIPVEPRSTLNFERRQAALSRVNEGIELLKERQKLLNEAPSNVAQEKLKKLKTAKDNLEKVKGFGGFFSVNVNMKARAKNQREALNNARQVRASSPDIDDFKKEGVVDKEALTAACDKELKELDEAIEQAEKGITSSKKLSKAYQEESSDITREILKKSVIATEIATGKMKEMESTLLNEGNVLEAGKLDVSWDYGETKDKKGKLSTYDLILTKPESEEEAKDAAKYYYELSKNVPKGTQIFKKNLVFFNEHLLTINGHGVFVFEKKCPDILKQAIEHLVNGAENKKQETAENQPLNNTGDAPKPSCKISDATDSAVTQDAIQHAETYNQTAVGKKGPVTVGDMDKDTMQTFTIKANTQVDIDKFLEDFSKQDANKSKTFVVRNDEGVITHGFKAGAYINAENGELKKETVVPAQKPQENARNKAPKPTTPGAAASTSTLPPSNGFPATNPTTGTPAPQTNTNPASSTTMYRAKVPRSTEPPANKGPGANAVPVPVPGSGSKPGV